MFLRQLIVAIGLFLFQSYRLSAQVVINEYSLGSGTSEAAYVELVVYGEKVCSNSTLDISGWIIDDNNGFHSGSGINPGCIRFPAIAQWQSIKAGSIIIVYNEANKGSKIPADDPSDSNSDYVYVLPANSPLLERNLTSPSASSSSYPTGGFSTASGGWATIGFDDGGDTFQIISPDSTYTDYHSVSYGNNNTNTMIYFNGSGNGRVFYLNRVDYLEDPFKMGKWAWGNSPSDETPGLTNNAANSTFINSLRKTFQQLDVSWSVVKPTCPGACDGEITAAGKYGYGPPYKYSWTSPSSITPKITSLCEGTYYLRITDPVGCFIDTFYILTAAVGLNVTASATPTTVCQGQSVQLVASGASTFSWLPISNEFNGASGSSVSINPNTTNNYSVVGTTNVCKDTAVVLVNVDFKPQVSINGVDSICKGNSVTLTASGATQYEWYQGGGIVSSSASYIATPANTTLYSVVGSTNGCKDTSEINISVIVTPLVNIAGSSPICSGVSTTLTASGAEEYSWNPSTGLSSSTISNPTANPNVSVDYTITGSNGNGLCKDIEIFNLTVNPTPDVQVSGDNYICTGESSVITASGAPSYSWTPPGGLNTTTGSTVTAQPSNTTVYIVSGYTAFCKKDVSFQLDVNSVAVANTATDIKVCYGSSKTLSSSGGMYYTWMPAGGLSAVDIPNPTVTTTSSTLYTLVVSNDCAGTNDTAFVNYQVISYPVVDFTLDETGGCSPLKLNINLSETPGDNCTWSFNNGATSNGCEIALELSDTGSYDLSVSITNSTGCKTDKDMPEIINVYPNPIADFSYLPNEPTIINPGIDFINKSKGASTYTWLFDNEKTSYAINPTFQYPDTGSYTITLATSTVHGCSDTIVKKLHIDEEHVIYIPLAFTPNNDNINDDFQIIGKGVRDNDYEFKLFNRWGDVVYVSNSIKDKWDGKVNGKTLPQDIYIYKFKYTDFKGNSHSRKGQLKIIR